MKRPRFALKGYCVNRGGNLYYWRGWRRNEMGSGWTAYDDEKWEGPPEKDPFRPKDRGREMAGVGACFSFEYGQAAVPPFYARLATGFRMMDANQDAEGDFSG